MLEFDEYLTSEPIRKKFPNQFKMVNYAIRLTQNKIRDGREGVLDSENPVNIVLEDIIDDIEASRDLNI